MISKAVVVAEDRGLYFHKKCKRSLAVSGNRPSGNGGEQLPHAGYCGAVEKTEIKIEGYLSGLLYLPPFTVQKRPVRP